MKHVFTDTMIIINDQIILTEFGGSVCRVPEVAPANCELALPGILWICKRQCTQKGWARSTVKRRHFGVEVWVFYICFNW